jgi:rubrerythrin
VATSASTPGGPAPSSVAQDLIRTQQEVLAHRQEVFEDWQQQWHATFTHSCRHCGFYMGDLWGPNVICPHCGRFPV